MSENIMTSYFWPKHSVLQRLMGSSHEGNKLIMESYFFHLMLIISKKGYSVVLNTVWNKQWKIISFSGVWYLNAIFWVFLAEGEVGGFFISFVFFFLSYLGRLRRWTKCWSQSCWLLRHVWLKIPDKESTDLNFSGGWLKIEKSKCS